jgi:hypothetical protein
VAWQANATGATPIRITSTPRRMIHPTHSILGLLDTWLAGQRRGVPDGLAGHVRLRNRRS